MGVHGAGRRKAESSNIMKEVCGDCDPFNDIKRPGPEIHFIRCHLCEKIYPYRNPVNMVCMRCEIWAGSGIVSGEVEFLTCFMCKGKWAVPTVASSNPFRDERAI